MFRHDFAEKLLAGGPAGFLHISVLLLNGDPARENRDSQFRRQVRDEAFVGVGIGAPQSMVEMPNPDRIPNLGERERERHRIRSAGHAGQNPIARLQHPMFFNCALNLECKR